MNQTENWRLIENVPVDTDFIVSNQGRVMEESKNKIVHQRKHHTSKKPFVRLVYENQYDTYDVCDLVAGAFLPNPEQKTYIINIDGNRANNHVSNLQYCSFEDLHITEHTNQIGPLAFTTFSHIQF